MFARAHGPSNPGLVRNGPSGARCEGHAPQNRPARPVGAAPGPLDQWSRPSAQTPGVRPKSPIPMPSRSVKPAGNRPSYGRYTAGSDASDRETGMRGTAACVPGWGPAAVSARSGKSAGSLRRGRGSVRRMLTCPASWGEDGRGAAGPSGTRDSRGSGHGTRGR
jgi:hypothetical protein